MVVGARFQFWEGNERTGVRMIEEYKNERNEKTVNRIKDE